MREILRRGRFKVGMDKDALNYTSSIEDDREIFEADILVNKAHIAGLIKTKILSLQDGEKILLAIKKIKNIGFDKTVKEGSFEDIHNAIETSVIQQIGEEVGGKIHTAKSRNDEVVTCIRIRLREYVLNVLSNLTDLLEILLSKAENEVNTIVPGFTHTQVAQPTSYAHILLAHYNVFERDIDRLLAAYGNINHSPLGSGAFSGTSFNIDRNLTARVLGFDGLVENTIDAVGSRDFAYETLAAYSLIAINVSRICEEIILWTSNSFEFLEISDSFSSTSSIMPQKKNPDVAEIARAKSGKIIGLLVGSLTISKNLPFAYNRDYQEITPILWEASKLTVETLMILGRMVETLRTNKEKMFDSLEKSYATATELADMLVKEKGLPFRTAHSIVGALVRFALNNNIKLLDINKDHLENVAKKELGIKLIISEKLIRKSLDIKSALSKPTDGGPAQQSIQNTIITKKAILKNIKKLIKSKNNKILKSYQSLDKMINQYTK